MTTSSNALSWGYGLGSMMRVGENLFGFYLIYYLSTVVGVSPGLAGAIGGSALLVGALASPLIGYLSDRSRSRFGRRRPFMLATGIPSMVLLTLLFTAVDLGEGTGAYYFVIALAFALTYYAFLVPYDALGASLTQDYNQRTGIRSICTAVLYISVLVGGTLVVQLQGIFAATLPPTTAWALAVILACTLPGALFAMIAWRATRGRDSPAPLAAGNTSSLKSTLSIFGLRPVRAILAWGLIYFFANALIAGSIIYFGVYVLGLSEGSASTLFIVSTVVTLLAVVPGNMLAKRLGKRNTIYAGMACFIFISSALFFIGIEGYLAGAVLSAAFGICNSLALSCSYAMIYDLREVTTLKLGEDKTAVILGWFSLVIGVSSSIAYITLGAILQAVGFDPAEAPTGAARSAIIALQTWVPATLLAVSSIALFFWNITARQHALVAEEIRINDAAKAPTISSS